MVLTEICSTLQVLRLKVSSGLDRRQFPIALVLFWR